MATYYVGIGGDNGNDGLSWANRKATLNGAEDIPVAPADVVWVGPGTYRETLTCDVSGTSGNIITYIGDVTGEHTDGVGGVVRIAASDNDTSGARTTCITASGKDYRTFRGFWVDSATSYCVYLTAGCNDWIVEDFIFGGHVSNGDYGIFIYQATPTNITIRRCNFLPSAGLGIEVAHTEATAASGLLIENCLFIARYYGLNFNYVDSAVVKNCTIVGSYGYAVRSQNAGAETTMSVTNCRITGNNYGLRAGTLGQLVEDYNNVVGNGTDRTNVGAGAHSTAYIEHLAAAPLLAGYVFPSPPPGTPAPWSPLRAIAGTSEAADDLYGVTRPTTSAKTSWGAVQYQPIARETTTTYDSSAASLKLSDAGEVQFQVPVTNASTTISVRVYREADYAGTLPQMVIKQPGQSDRTTVDTGDAGEWNELTDTFTPAAAPGYVVVVLRSNNTASSGNYDAFFDSLQVS